MLYIYKVPLPPGTLYQLLYATVISVCISTVFSACKICTLYSVHILHIRFQVVIKFFFLLLSADRFYPIAMKGYELRQQLKKNCIKVEMSLKCADVIFVIRRMYLDNLSNIPNTC